MKALRGRLFPLVSKLVSRSTEKQTVKMYYWRPVNMRLYQYQNVSFSYRLLKKGFLYRIPPPKKNKTSECLCFVFTPNWCTVPTESKLKRVSLKS